jgi:Zn-dependent protease with chaperone function
MDSLAKLLLGLGITLVAAGIAFLILARFGAHRLPGDVVIRRGNFTLYLPFGLMIVLSLLLTLVLNLFSRK